MFSLLVPSHGTKQSLFSDLAVGSSVIVFQCWCPDLVTRKCSCEGCGSHLSGWWRPNKGDPKYEKRWITFGNYCPLLLANSTSENPLRLLWCHLHSGLEDISTEHGKFFLSCGSETTEHPELLNYRPGFHDMVPASFQTCTWKHLRIQIGSCTSVYLICKWRDGFFFFFHSKAIKALQRAWLEKICIFMLFLPIFGKQRW